MKLMDWKKILAEDGEKMVELGIEQLTIDISVYEYQIKKMKMDIERGKKLIEWK